MARISSMIYGFVSPHNLEKITRGILVDMNNYTIHAHAWMPEKAHVLTDQYYMDADLTTSYLTILREMYTK